MGRRRLVLKQRIEDSTFDLNLAPMLDIMVSLIPMLLLSIAFAKLVVLDAPVPQPVANAIENDKKERTVMLQLHLFNNRTAKLDIIDKGGRRSNISFSSKEGTYDLETIHQKLIDVKKMHTQVFTVEIFPEEGVAYKEIVAVMDEARSARKEEGEFQFIDKESKQAVKTKAMFPNITFGNVIEG
ncbi:MAG: biopolymer transporter ExbD [Bdellovibrionales bacterium]|nr:biopolymer transporter ExbD [Bdellovibrionales bacterium]